MPLRVGGVAIAWLRVWLRKCGGISITPHFFASQLGARSWFGWEALQIPHEQTSKPASQQAPVRVGVPPNNCSQSSTMAAAILALRRSSMAGTLIGSRSPAATAATVVCVGNSWIERMRPISTTVGVGGGERSNTAALAHKSWVVGHVLPLTLLCLDLGSTKRYTSSHSDTMRFACTRFSAAYATPLKNRFQHSCHTNVLKNAYYSTN